jgi:hypothetical protein
MTPIDLQDRARYLSLALFAQEVVSVLIKFVDEGQNQKLNPSLGEALKSLEAAEPAAALNHRHAAAFTNYEQLRTLEEVWKAADRDAAKEMIQTVLREPQNPKAKAAASKLIDLFSMLQDQALWNFEQPRPVSPGAMQRLCKMA